MVLWCFLIIKGVVQQQESPLEKADGQRRRAGCRIFPIRCTATFSDTEPVVVLQSANYITLFGSQQYAAWWYVPAKNLINGLYVCL